MKKWHAVSIMMWTLAPLSYGLAAGRNKRNVPSATKVVMGKDVGNFKVGNYQVQIKEPLLHNQVVNEGQIPAEAFPTIVVTRKGQNMTITKADWFKSANPYSGSVLPDEPKSENVRAVINEHLKKNESILRDWEFIIDGNPHYLFLFSSGKGGREVPKALYIRPFDVDGWMFHRILPEEIEKAFAN